MGADPCGRRGEGVESISPSETGTTRRKLRDVKETGKPGSAAGDWHWRAASQVQGEPGNWNTRYGAVVQGPLHLIRGGGLVSFCPTLAFLPGPTRENSPGCHPRLTARWVSRVRVPPRGFLARGPWVPGPWSASGSLGRGPPRGPWAVVRLGLPGPWSALPASGDTAHGARVAGPLRSSPVPGSRHDVRLPLGGCDGPRDFGQGGPFGRLLHAAGEQPRQHAVRVQVEQAGHPASQAPGSACSRASQLSMCWSGS